MRKISFPSRHLLLVALAASLAVGCGSRDSSRTEVKGAPSEDGPGEISIVCYGDDLFDYPTPPPYDPSKKRMSRAKVKVTEEGGKTVKTGVTDEEGFFKIELPPGTYRVDVTGTAIEADALRVRVEPRKTSSLELHGHNRRFR